MIADDDLGLDGSADDRQLYIRKAQTQQLSSDDTPHLARHQQPEVVRSADGSVASILIPGVGRSTTVYSLSIQYYAQYPRQLLSGVMEQHVYEMVLERLNQTIESHWPCSLITWFARSHFKATKAAMEQILRDANTQSFAGDPQAGRAYRWQLKQQQSKSWVEIVLLGAADPQQAGNDR